MIIDSFFQKKAMEFRKSCSRSFAHFVFYPSQKSEKDALEQTKCLKIDLVKLLSDAGVSFVLGAHYHQCLRQCGFIDDASECVAAECDEQKNKRGYGKCILSSNPVADSQNLCNHVHLLLHISNKVKNTNEKDDFPFSHMPSTNWALETVIDIVRNYFNAHQPGPGLAFPKGFRVEQRNVWCPFSIFAAFVHLQKSHVVIQGSVFQKTFKKAWQNHPENQRYFPKRPPVLRSKTVWQLHCH